MSTTITDADRLRIAFEGKSRAQFCRDTGFSGGPSMVSQHLSGNRPISLMAAKTYAKWLGVSVRDISPSAADEIEELQAIDEEQDLSTTEANNGRGRGNVKIAESGDPNLVEIRKVSLRLSAGIRGFAADQDFEEGHPLSFRRSWLEKNGYVPEKLIAVKIKGESMEPSLYEGDTVVINTADLSPKDGEVYAVNYEGEAVIKRLVRDIGHWWLYSDNQDQRKFNKKICQGDACIIIGKVIHKQSERI